MGCQGLRPRLVQPHLGPLQQQRGAGAAAEVPQRPRCVAEGAGEPRSPRATNGSATEEVKRHFRRRRRCRPGRPEAARPTRTTR